MEKFKLSLYAIALAIAIACHQRSAHAPLPPIEVEVAEATNNQIFERLEVATEIQSLYDATIQPRIDGFLDSITYNEGMPINRGDLLFIINPDTYKIALLAAQSNLESAVAQEILAHNNYRRALPLAQIDAISKSDLDQYRATHNSALAAVKSAEEEVKNAELNLSYTNIIAPIDGIIAATAAKEGDFVGPSTIYSALTTISFTDSVIVEIPIPSSIYLKKVKGDSFDNANLLSNIMLTLSDGDIFPYLGEYDYTLKSTPSASSSVVVMAKFPNPNHQLKPGMFARIKANIGAPKSTITIPQSAVSQTQGVNSVWVMKPDSTVEFREVVLGATSNNDWIIDEGVAAGEDVLTTGQLKVHNGAKVIPTKK